MPNVQQGQWVYIGETRIPGYVFTVIDDQTISVGYYQNDLKAIRETAVWDGDLWRFETSGPSGSYLRGAEEAIVKRGPRG